MRIAVTYDEGHIFQHFGHTKQFKLYDIEDGKICTSSIVSTDGSGHGALATMLKNIQVDMLICGGIGDGAKNALSAVNIKLYGGITGNADKAVDDFLHHKLAYIANVTCAHHGEHQQDGGHHCGEHHCGGHHHGKHHCGQHSCADHNEN